MKYIGIDANGILTVTAQDKGTGKQQEIKITGSSGLSEDEIEKMIEMLRPNKADDEKRKELLRLEID